MRLSWVPWDVGTPIDAYPRWSELRLEDMAPPGIPSVQSAVVDADSTVTFTGLDPGEYWAVGALGGGVRYVAFNFHEGE